MNVVSLGLPDDALDLGLRQYELKLFLRLRRFRMGAGASDQEASGVIKPLAQAA